MSCVKRVPIEEFIKTDKTENINKKVEDLKEYPINSINYIENHLEISISEIAKQKIFSIGERKTYDLYRVGVREEFNGKAIGITAGLICGLASFGYGIYSIVDPPTTEECMDYKTGSGKTTPICKKEKKFPVLGLISLTIGTGGSIGLGYGISKIKKVYKEDMKEEIRNSESINVNELIDTKIVKEGPAVDIPVELSSDYFLFDDKSNAKLLTDKDGRAKVNVKAKNKNFSFTKERFYQMQIIKDLKFLGMEEEIKKVMKNINKVEYPATLKINEEDMGIVLTGYELPESKLEELTR